MAGFFLLAGVVLVAGFNPTDVFRKFSIKSREYLRGRPGPLCISEAEDDISLSLATSHSYIHSIVSEIIIDIHNLLIRGAKDK
jgi:hypothetical protein